AKMDSVSTNTQMSIATFADEEQAELKFIEKNLIMINKPGVMDELSARFLPSFAYVTMKTRSPALIRDLITFLREQEPKIMEECGDYAHFDLKRIIWSLELLREDIVKNREFEVLRVKAPDTENWNKFLKGLSADKNNWFSSLWVHAECYMYRRIWSIFHRSDTMANYDYFGHQKILACTSTALQMSTTLLATRGLERSLENFQLLMKLCVWSNRCDLSISREVPDDRIYEKLSEYDSDLLVNQSADIWNVLIEAYEPVYVDIVCDNAGFELFSDFLLGDYIIQSRLARRVRFHVKAIPWFISDATHKDFHWMLSFFCKNKQYPELKAFGCRMRRYLRNRSFILHETSYFWTSAHVCSQMKEVQPCLYVALSEASLAIFKGDLNYRKLLGDINNKSTAELSDCLQGFLPTSICALRAIKSDIYCGLPVCTVEWLTEDDPKWMLTGQKAIIQLATKHRLSGDTLA
ncbi:hypothetical protein KR009_002435, partial [Drosophila setifemur]